MNYKNLRKVDEPFITNSDWAQDAIAEARQIAFSVIETDAGRIGRALLVLADLAEYIMGRGFVAPELREP